MRITVLLISHKVTAGNDAGELEVNFDDIRRKGNYAGILIANSNLYLLNDIHGIYYSGSGGTKIELGNCAHSLLSLVFPLKDLQNNRQCTNQKIEILCKNSTLSTTDVYFEYNLLSRR